MRNSEELKSSNLRKRLLISYHEDGLLDLVIGTVALLLALVMATEAAVFVGMVGIPIVFYIPLKERIAVPRRGLIRFDPESETRRKLWWITALGVVAFLIIAGIAFFGAGPSQNLMDFLQANGGYILALIVAAHLWVAGHLMSNGRLGYYALLSVVVFSGAQFLGQRSWLPMALIGTVMLVAGAVLLSRFLRRYPTNAGGAQ